ncbi:MAG: Na/Pi symporter [Oligoflexia bacterium]|nr:Na/Pi symporter [Oligoflexia bacterium]
MERIKKRSTALRILLLFIALNLFFLSINMMGAFKGDTKEYAVSLLTILHGNPFIGLLLGILLTAVMQSSSATTSIVVTFVASGLFGAELKESLRAAIPIIMGANIGTSITSAIVSIGHIGNEKEFKRAFTASTVHDLFNLLAAAALFPIQVYTNFLGILSYKIAGLFSSVESSGFSSPLKMLVDPQKKFLETMFENYAFVSKFVLIFVASFVLIFLLYSSLKKLIAGSTRLFGRVALISLYISFVGVAFSEFGQYVFNKNIAQFVFALFVLFYSLSLFVKIMRKLATGKIELLFNNYIFKNAPRAFMLGLVLTAVIQSSSVTISVVIPLAGAGMLNVYQIFPYALGANVGTTITALLAALALGNTGALAIAFAHLLFNIFGVLLFYPLKIVPITLAKKFAEVVIYNKILPILFILTLYILLPLAGILLSR